MRERIDEIWSVDPPEGALDLRGASPEERRDRVRTAYTALEPGETFDVVSDRDPTPVREYLDEVVDDPAAVPDSIEVKRQNPETWLLRTTRPAAH